MGTKHSGVVDQVNGSVPAFMIAETLPEVHPSLGTMARPRNNEVSLDQAASDVCNYNSILQTDPRKTAENNAHRSTGQTFCLPQGSANECVNEQAIRNKSDFSDTEISDRMDEELRFRRNYCKTRSLNELSRPFNCTPGPSFSNGDRGT